MNSAEELAVDLRQGEQRTGRDDKEAPVLRKLTVKHTEACRCTHSHPF